jgi:hypothetical protein
MSAPKAENGFVGRRIVSSRRGRRNNSNKKVNDFNDRKATGAEKFGSFGLRNQCRFAAYGVSARPGRKPALSLLADRREGISAAPDGADHGGLGGGRLDLGADSQIDGAITLNARRPDLHVKQHVQLRDLAAPCARVLQIHLPSKGEGAGDPQERAQGRPGARCTRGLMCKGSKKTHMSIQVQRKQSGLPCAMVLQLISCSPR